MSAYILYICRSVSDRKELETYWRMLDATLEGRPGKLLTAYAELDILEGDGPVEGLMLMEFPSMEDARDWHNSAAYREARQHHMRGAKYLCILSKSGRHANKDDRMPQTRNRTAQSSG
jgi:uncharacterized protein (DUF1330 family)